MSPQETMKTTRIALLRGGGLGDSKEGATKGSLDCTKEAPWQGLGLAEDTRTRLDYAHMGFTTCVVCTPRPQ